MKQKPRKDRTGEIIKGLKIISWDKERSLQSETKTAYWFCECLTCHQITSINYANLKFEKKIENCGKCDRVLLIGKKFNRLTVKEYLGKRIETYKNNKPHYRDWFLCECDCGNFIETTAHSLKCNNTKSIYSKPNLFNILSIAAVVFPEPYSVTHTFEVKSLYESIVQ